MTWKVRSNAGPLVHPVVSPASSRSKVSFWGFSAAFEPQLASRSAVATAHRRRIITRQTIGQSGAGKAGIAGYGRLLEARGSVLLASFATFSHGRARSGHFVSKGARR